MQLFQKEFCYRSHTALFFTDQIENPLQIDLSSLTIQVSKSCFLIHVGRNSGLAILNDDDNIDNFLLKFLLEYM